MGGGLARNPHTFARTFACLVPKQGVDWGEFCGWRGGIFNNDTKRYSETNNRVDVIFKSG